MALVRALAGTGRQLDVIRQYPHLRTALRQQLEVESAAQTQALIGQIQGR